MSLLTRLAGAMLPDVQTVAESGRKSFDMSDWKLLAAPAGTPAASVKRLNAEGEKAMSKPATLAHLLAEGSVLMRWLAAGRCHLPQDPATALGRRRPRERREG